MKNLKKDTIYRSNKRLYWKDIKNLELQDDDEIISQWNEAYYGSDSSYEGHYESKVIRSREETEEEKKKRIKNEKQRKKESDERLYETYLNLKKRFEKNEQA